MNTDGHGLGKQLLKHAGWSAAFRPQNREQANRPANALFRLGLFRPEGRAPSPSVSIRVHPWLQLRFLA
jgi:hypothetical protein